MNSLKFRSNRFALLVLTSLLVGVHAAGNAYDDANTSVLMHASVADAQFTRDAGAPDRQQSKLLCTVNVVQTMKSLEDKLRAANDKLDLEFNCKSLVMWGTPAKTIDRHNSFQTPAVFFYQTHRLINTLTFGANIFVGCEQRSMSEQVIVAAARRCKQQWNDDCFKFAASENARATGVRYLRLVNPEAICGLTSAGSDSTSGASTVREMP